MHCRACRLLFVVVLIGGTYAKSTFRRDVDLKIGESLREISYNSKLERRIKRDENATDGE